jgi:hypothetical protein
MIKEDHNYNNYYLNSYRPWGIKALSLILTEYIISLIIHKYNNY